VTGEWPCRGFPPNEANRIPDSRRPSRGCNGGQGKKKKREGEKGRAPEDAAPTHRFLDSRLAFVMGGGRKKGKKGGDEGFRVSEKGFRALISADYEKK